MTDEVLDLSVVQFLITDAVNEIHHYDNRKYQFVYVLAASLVSALVTGSAGGFTHEYAPFIATCSIFGVLLLLLVPSIVALQAYTRTENNLRNDLVRANHRLLTREIDHDDWIAQAFNAYTDWANNHKAMRKRHPWLYRVLDVLT